MDTITKMFFFPHPHFSSIITHFTAVVYNQGAVGGALEKTVIINRIVMCQPIAILKKPVSLNELSVMSQNSTTV